MSAMNRRGFLGVLGAGVLSTGGMSGAQQFDSLAGRGATGTLRDPGVAGMPRDRVTAVDNDMFIQDVEHRIKCQCGCNLDVFTCRTTDFTCGTSPRMHREVLALHRSGKDAQGIVDAFVAQYGEQVLMAPKPVGFNWAGYLVPGVLVLLGGGILAAVLRRRIAATAGTSPMAASTSAAPVSSASPEDLERLRRALAGLES
jgi:cytochrome c-type biogenesis protein CcmH/NrfF